MQSYSPQSTPSHIESGERQPTQLLGDCVFVDFSVLFDGRRPSLRAISTILRTSSHLLNLASNWGEESAGVATTTPSKFLEEYASATSARTDASSSGSIAMRCSLASTPGGSGSVHAQGNRSLHEGQC